MAKPLCRRLRDRFESYPLSGRKGDRGKVEMACQHPASEFELFWAGIADRAAELEAGVGDMPHPPAGPPT